ncbi:MAG: hypothetical protein LBN00_07105, partial [Oscillospiraceae bacterium]|nr:hypothetical protein [Oscillospiraceae bacterium]
MKRLISIILAIAMIATLGALSTAADAGEVAANKLFTLGLFIGVGDNADGTPNFELGREPTRAEGVTLLVRFLGKEKEALAGTWNTPFTDVADWAKPYVGYAYANGITYGISYTEYGGSIAITAAQYLTFILRALGYEDGYDFSWSSAWTLSDQIGFTAGEFNSRNNTILRGGVADISFKALIAKYFGTDTYVIRALYDEKVVTKQAVVDVGLGKYIEDEKTEEKEKETSSSDDYFSSPA